MVATSEPTASQPEPLSALLAHGSDRSTAFVTPEDGRTQDYAQVAEAVETLAGRLAAAGVRRGDRVGMTLPNGPEFVLLLFAAAQLGAAAAPLNPAYTQSEFTFYLEDIAPRLLLVSGTGPQAAVAAAGPLSIPVIELAIGADGPPDLIIDGAPVSAVTTFDRGDADDIALVLHTSGTTSRPKQVPLRQRNLMASARTIAAHYQLTSDDVSFCVMPLFHIHGLVASDVRGAEHGRHGGRAAPVHRAPVLAAGPRRRGHLAVRGADAAPDDPRPPGRRRRPGHAAVRPLVQLAAVARAAGTGRGRLRRADAGGLRDDRGQPPDGVQPAAARGPRTQLGRRPDRHRDRASSTRPAPSSPRGSRRGRHPRARRDVRLR